MSFVTASAGTIGLGACLASPAATSSCFSCLLVGLFPLRLCLGRLGDDEDEREEGD